jgi:hypothetical protein
MGGEIIMTIKKCLDSKNKNEYIFRSPNTRRVTTVGGCLNDNYSGLAYIGCDWDGDIIMISNNCTAELWVINLRKNEMIFIREV